MNNKLKIYARETKNGKEINQTQLVAVPYPLSKTIQQPKQRFTYASKQKQLKENKNSESLTINEKEQFNSYLKKKTRSKSSNKRNKSLNLNSSNYMPKKEINATQSGIKFQSKTPLKVRSISKKKVEESINIVIKLKEAISYLNHQIDAYEEEHNNIYSFGEDAITQLQEENRILKTQSTIENEEEYQSHIYIEQFKLLKEKENAIALLKKEINEVDTKISILKEKHDQLREKINIRSLKEDYQQKIQNLDNEMEAIPCQRKHNYCIYDTSAKLLSTEEQLKIGFILNVMFGACSLTIEAVLNEIFPIEEPISFDTMADNLLLLINNTNKQSRVIIISFLETIANENPNEFTNIDIIKNNFALLIGDIDQIFNNDELNDKLIQIMYSNREQLLKAFYSKDHYLSGLISFDEFNEIMTEFKYTNLDNYLYKYLIYLMKEGTESKENILKLAYENLINVLDISEKENTDIDKELYYAKIRDHLIDNNIKINDLMVLLGNDIQMDNDREYISNEVFNYFLKNKGIILPFENIPCDQDNMNDITSLRKQFL